MVCFKTLTTWLFIFVAWMGPTSLVFGADDKPLSLEDLGFKQTEIQGSPELQLQLEKRTSMLQIHQKLGFITAIPMIAQFLLYNDVNRNATHRNIHTGIGITTAVLYGTTASFAIFAPKPPGIQDKGSTKIHRALAWVHGPLMILTPILGAMAYTQINNGEKTHGIAKFHGASAALLLASYLASMTVMAFEF